MGGVADDCAWTAGDVAFVGRVAATRVRFGRGRGIVRYETRSVWLQVLRDRPSCVLSAGIDCAQRNGWKAANRRRLTEFQVVWGCGRRQNASDAKTTIESSESPTKFNKRTGPGCSGRGPVCCGVTTHQASKNVEHPSQAHSGLCQRWAQGARYGVVIHPIQVGDGCSA